MTSVYVWPRGSRYARAPPNARPVRSEGLFFPERRFTGRGGGFRKREARARTTNAWQSSRQFGGGTRPCASRVADTLPRAGVGAAADLPRHARIFVFAPRRNRRFTRERFVDFRQKVIRTCTMKRVPRCVPDPEALPPLPTLPPVPTRVSIDRFPNTKKNTSLKTRRISGARD